MAIGGGVVNGRRAPLPIIALLVLVSLVGTAVSKASPAASETTSPRTLARAGTIRAEVNARYQQPSGRRLAVVEASPTSVIESFTLLSEDLLETRYVPADNGIYFSVCPAGASCPYVAPRFARPATDYLPRRLALELALRTFVETDAAVVAVSLPTRHFLLLVLERGQLGHEGDMSALLHALRRDPLRSSSSSLRRSVDVLTRPRMYSFVAYEPTPSGGTSWGGLPRWPRSSS